jgi:tetratricopeptide (TPR) repeat protein
MQHLNIGKRGVLVLVLSAFVWRLGAQAGAVTGGVGAGVTDSAAVQLGRAIDRDDDDRRQNRLSHILDENSFISRMAENCPPLKDPAFRRGFMETFPPNLPKIGASLANAANGGSYRLLREYDSNGVKHLLFRTFGKQGLNYHDYLLIKVGDSIKVTDIYLYTTGEYFSYTIANLVTTADAPHDVEKESEEGKALKIIREDYTRHNYPEAKAIYDGLSPKLKEDKAIQIVYISIARKISDSLYEAALDHFQAVFPDAPNSYLLMIDLCYLKKNYQKGLETVDKLDGMVGDPILNLLRGNFVKLSGKQEESLGYYQKAYQFDPGFKMNTRTLIATYAEMGRLDDAKKVIAEFKRQKGFLPEDLDSIYAAFPSLKD